MIKDKILRSIIPDSKFLIHGTMSQVKIYTTPSCVYCKMAKDFFQKNNIQYEEKNVAADIQARDEMIMKSGQLGVPVIEVNGKIVIGYDQGRLRELLAV